ncbi:MAG: nitrate/nitrite transporter NrtS [Alphaproteobacteria bacterium]|uniref:Nitrate/nitrite transporter NrtS n=1 Tax=Candidatus Nitrobium versatile TaxID=2884831 RepID=A0A953SH78_9BACT|nr:nitrate/nitrite transporter NrtS [Candidatus Nitrobium versatile]
MGWIEQHSAICKRALRASLFVGVVLVIINHSGVLFGEEITHRRLMQIVLCFVVPFVVSAYSQVSMIKPYRAGRDHFSLRRYMEKYFFNHKQYSNVTVQKEAEMASMSSLERVAATLQLKEPDRVPVIPVVMIRALKEAGLKGSRDVLHDPHLMAGAKIESYKKFGGDALIAGTGLNVEAEAMGCLMEYLDEGIPVVLERPLERDPSLEQLQELDTSKGRVPSVAKEVSILSKEYGANVVIGAPVSGPFTTAMELRGLEKGISDYQNNPGYFNRLMEHATEAAVRYADILIDHGALGLVLLDPLSSCDVISPSFYRSTVMPSQMKVINHIKTRGRVPIIHICAYTEPIWKDIVSLGAFAFHGDILPGIKSCKEQIGSQICLVGNVDPVQVLFYGTPSDVRAAAEECIRQAAPGGGFILASGCDTGYDVPSDNILSLVETAHRFSYPLPF